jgi:hypothetical protein
MQINAAEWDKVHAQLLDDAVAHPEKYHRRGERMDGNPIAIGPRISPPEEWAENYEKGVVNNAEKWLKHVTNPSRNPITAAIAAEEKWKNGMTEAIAKGRWGKAMKQADPDMMIETLKAMGTTAYVSGVQARRAKMAKKINKLQALVSAHVTAMDALPTNTAPQRREKMLKNLDGMILVGDKMKGG